MLVLSSAAHAALVLPAESNRKSVSSGVASELTDRGEISVLTLDGDYSRGNSAIRETVSRALLAQHADEYDFLFVATAFPFEMGEARGLYHAVSNDVSGIGASVFDHSARFGSSRLQGYIDLGPVTSLGLNPSDPGFQAMLNLMGHEWMHRWGIFTKYRDDSGELRADLLGAEGTHWSYYADTGASLMYGARWQLRADGRFEAIESRRRLGTLDLYLAGLAAPSEVAPVRLLPNGSASAQAIPQLGDVVDGPGALITLEQIVAAQGPRVPGADRAPRHFRGALLLLLRPGQSPSADMLASLELLRVEFEQYFRSITRGRAIIRLELATGASPATGSPSVPAQSFREGAQPSNASEWLLATQRPDGSWFDHPATALRDTAAALLALQPMTAAETARNQAWTWLSAQSPRNQEEQGWLAVAQQSMAGSTATLTPAETDQGWGVLSGWTSGLHDTAAALRVRRVLGLPPTSTGIDRLLAAQNPDGGFGFVSAGASRAVTGIWIASLLAEVEGSNARSAFERFQAWLLSRGPLALLADASRSRTQLLPVLELLASDGGRLLPIAIRSPAYQFIRSQQGVDGGFAGSTYATALGAMVLASEGVADLALSHPSVLPAAPVRGEPALLVVTVSNAGGVVAPTSVLRWRLADSTVVATAQVAALAPGRSVEVALRAETLEWPLAASLEAQADADLVVAEADEVNNRTSLQVGLATRSALADPAIFSADVGLAPAQISALPATIRVQGRLRNLGDGAASAVKVVVVDLDGGETLAQTQVDFTTAASSPLALEFVASEARAMNLVVRIDPDGAWSEPNEHNNELRLTLGLAPAIDLVPDATGLLVTPSPAVLGDDLQLRIPLRNLGTLDAPPAMVQLQRWDGADWLPLASATVAVSAAAQQMVELHWRVDREGELRLRLIADPAGAVAETDESNNAVEFSLRVDRSAEANLRLGSPAMRIDPAPLRQTQPFSLHATIGNSGGQDSPPFSVALFQGDPRIDGQRLAVLRVAEPIAGGAERAISLRADDYPFSGDGVLYLQIDSDNEVVERSESDNMAVLEVEALTAADLSLRGELELTPLPPVPGQALVIRGQIENRGQQGSAPVDVVLHALAEDGDREITPRQSLPAINAGGSATLTWRWDVPADADLSGLRLAIDPGQQLREHDESNNVVVMHFDLQDGDAFLSERFFSPNGDGRRDSVEAVFRSEAADHARVQVRNAVGRIIHSLPAERGSDGLLRARWDGRDEFGTVVADGTYTLQLSADAALASTPLSVVLDRDRAMPLDDLRGPKARLLPLPASVNGWQAAAAVGSSLDNYLYSVGSAANEHNLLRSGIARFNVLFGALESVVDARWLARRLAEAGLAEANVSQLMFSRDGRSAFFSLHERSSSGSQRTSIWQLPLSRSAAPRRVGELSGTWAQPLLDALDDQRLLLGDRADASTLQLLDITTGVMRAARSDAPDFALAWSDGRGMLLSVDGRPRLYLPFDAEQPALGLWSEQDGSVLKRWRILGPQARVLLHTGTAGQRDAVTLIDLASGARLPVYGGEPDNAVHAGLQAPMASLEVRWLQRQQQILILDHGQRALLRFDDKGDAIDRAALPADGREGHYVAVAAELEDGYGYDGYGGSDGGTPSIAAVVRGMLLEDRASEVCRGQISAAAVGAGFAPSPLAVATLDGDEALSWDPLTASAYVASGEVVYAVRQAAQDDGYGYGGSGLDAATRCAGIVDHYRVALSGTSRRLGGHSVWPLELGADRQRYPPPDFDALGRSRPPADWPRFIHANGTTLFRSGRVQRAGHWFVERAFALGGHRLGDLQDEGRLLFAAEPHEPDAPPAVAANVLSTLNRLTAELRAESDGRGIRLWGIASDAHLASYRLEWAPIDDVSRWRALDAQTGVEVVFDDFLTWVPPTVGAFVFRLTVEDRAGNRSEAFASASVERAAPLSQVRASSRLISPNGDGALDELVLAFEVLREHRQRIVVRDDAGRSVHESTLDFGATELGAQSWRWQGRDQAGTPVADGKYSVDFDSGFRLPVEVDRTPPVLTVDYRGLDPTWLGSGAPGCSDPSDASSEAPAGDDSPLPNAGPSYAWSVYRPEAPDLGRGVQVVLEGRAPDSSRWRLLEGPFERFEQIDRRDCADLSPRWRSDYELRLVATDAAGNRSQQPLGQRDTRLVLGAVPNARELVPVGPRYLSFQHPEPIHYFKLGDAISDVRVEVRAAADSAAPWIALAGSAEAASDSMPGLESGAIQQSVDLSHFAPLSVLQMRLRGRSAAGAELTSQTPITVTLGGARMRAEQCLSDAAGDPSQALLRVALLVPVNSLDFRPRLQATDRHGVVRQFEPSRPAPQAALDPEQLLFALPFDDYTAIQLVVSDRHGREWRIAGDPTLLRQACPQAGTTAQGYTLSVEPELDLHCGAAAPTQLKISLRGTFNSEAERTEALARTLQWQANGPEGARISATELTRLGAVAAPPGDSRFHAVSETRLPMQGLAAGRWRGQVLALASSGDRSTLVAKEFELSESLQVDSIAIESPRASELVCSGRQGVLPLLGTVVGRQGRFRVASELELSSEAAACSNPLDPDFPLGCYQLSDRLARAGGVDRFGPGRVQGLLAEHRWTYRSSNPLLNCSPNADRHCYPDGPVRSVVAAHYPAMPAQCASVLFEQDAGTTLSEVFEPIASPCGSGFRRCLAPRGKQEFREARWKLRPHESVAISAEVFIAEPDPATSALAPLYRATDQRVATLALGTHRDPAQLGWNGAGASDGIYAIRFRSEDRCEHSDLLERFIELDGSGPAISIRTPLQNSESRQAVIPIEAAIADWHGGRWTLSVSTQGGTQWAVLARGAVDAASSPASLPETVRLLAQWPTRSFVGTVHFKIEAEDALGNPSADVRAVQLLARESLIDAVQPTPVLFSPNADGVLDSTRIGIELLRPVLLTVSVQTATGVEVARLADDRRVNAGRIELAWNGQGASGGGRGWPLPAQGAGGGRRESGLPGRGRGPARNRHTRAAAERPRAQQWVRAL